MDAIIHEEKGRKEAMANGQGRPPQTMAQVIRILLWPFVAIAKGLGRGCALFVLAWVMVMGTVGAFWLAGTYPPVGIPVLLIVLVVWWRVAPVLRSWSHSTMPPEGSMLREHELDRAEGKIQEWADRRQDQEQW
jgi:hypothetical protein